MNTTITDAAEFIVGVDSPKSRLELLIETRDRVANPMTQFEFQAWTHCTCGHIYLTAEGQKGPGRAVHTPGPKRVTYVDLLEAVIAGNRKKTLYRKRMDAVLMAAKIDGRRMTEEGARRKAAPQLVSEMTYNLAHATWSARRLGGSIDYRAAAVELLNRAIRHEERQLEKARLRVLEQAAAVVNEAAPAPLPDADWLTKETVELVS